MYIEDYVVQTKIAHPELGEMLEALYPWCDGDFSVAELAREFGIGKRTMERIVESLSPLLIKLYF